MVSAKLLTLKSSHPYLVLGVSSVPPYLARDIQTARLAEDAVPKCYPCAQAPRTAQQGTASRMKSGGLLYSLGNGER